LNLLKESANAAVEPADERNDFLTQNSCWHMLNYLAENKDEEKLQKLVDVLIENKVLPVTNLLLGSLIKVKLLK